MEKKVKYCFTYDPCLGPGCEIRDFVGLFDSYESLIKGIRGLLSFEAVSDLINNEIGDKEYLQNCLDIRIFKIEGEEDFNFDDIYSLWKEDIKKAKEEYCKQIEDQERANYERLKKKFGE